MFAFMQENYATILVLGLVVAVILFAICIIRRCIRLAIGIAILSVIVPVLFTIFWGDGTAYIAELASYLNPKHQQQIEEAYAYYKAKDAEDPIINYDAVSDKITDVFSSVQEKEDELIETTKDSSSKYLDDLLKKAIQQSTTKESPGA